MDKLLHPIIEISIEDTPETIPASCHTVACETANFEIFVDSEEHDEITQAIADSSYYFPISFQLLPDLLGGQGCVLDLGAHIGTFSLFAAALGYPVVSVEASPRNSSLLKANARRNHFDQMRVVATAVGDRTGSIEFIQAGPYGLVANTFLKTPTITVPVTTVDALLAQVGWEKVDFVKMDIEGSEVNAIRGMPRLLARDDAPMILYESNGHTLNLLGETPGSLMAALESFGYHCYLVQPRRLVPWRSLDLQAECNVDCLATKQTPYHTGWPLASAPSADMIVAAILATCSDANPHVRAYIARAMAQPAGAAFLKDARVLAAISNLTADLDADVRAAACWIKADAPGSTQHSGRVGHHRLVWRRFWTRLKRD